MGQKQSLCHGPREWQYFSTVCHVSSSGRSRPHLSRELHLELINSVVFKSSLDSCSLAECQLTSLCPWNVLSTGLQLLSPRSLNSPAAITAIVSVRSTLPLSPASLPPCLTIGPSRTGWISYSPGPSQTYHLLSRTSTCGQVSHRITLIVYLTAIRFTSTLIHLSSVTVSLTTGSLTRFSAWLDIPYHVQFQLWDPIVMLMLSNR